MGPYLIPHHLAICENRKEGIDGVVGESPAILRERRWAGGIIREDLRQHCPCHPPRFLRDIPTRMLQRMSEGGNETDIVRRLPCEVGISLRAGETRTRKSCRGRAPRSAWIQPPSVPSARTSVRCHRPTALPPKAKLGTSSTMLHTSLSAKKSSPMNCKLFTAPLLSKKKGSLRRPAKNR